MNPGLVIKLRPTGPWRAGPDNGARDEVDAVYHSDTLYSAVTWAMQRLGHFDAWLDATARNPAGSAVGFSSLYPYLDDIGFIAPPRTAWPPDSVSGKVRWKGARFVPLGLVAALFSGAPLEEAGWKIDGASLCLLPANRGGVFRTIVRSSAAVDRLSGAVDPYQTAGIEFFPGAGLWCVASFADDDARARWADLLRAAFRLLADSGFGGRRSLGWGRAAEPEFIEGSLPEMILSFDGAENFSSWWMLSVFAPGAGDAIDWKSGNYAVLTRGGRVQNAGDRKKDLSMLVEGSVVVCPAAPRGSAPDVAPDGFPHPVYRAGFAVAIPVPSQVIL